MEFTQSLTTGARSNWRDGIDPGLNTGLFESAAYLSGARPLCFAVSGDDLGTALSRFVARERSPETATACTPGVGHPWLIDLEQECRDHLADLLFLAPWLSRGPTPSGVWTQGSPERAELRLELQGVLQQLDDCQTLRSLKTTSERALQVLDHALEQITVSAVTGRTEREWFTELREKISTSEQRVLERLATIEQLARVTGEFAEADYEFLYDPARRLLAIGFDVSERRRDASFYDLLASESRLCSYVAIAQGQLKQEHWFALGGCSPLRTDSRCCSPGADRCSST